MARGAATRRRPSGHPADTPRPRRSRSSGRSNRVRRYAVVYDIEGPRVRLGILWFVALVAALALGPLATAALLAVVSGVAAGQIATTWRKKRRRPHVFAAMAFGALLPAGAVFGAGGLGVTILATVGGAWMVASSDPKRRVPVVEQAAMTVQCVLFVGLAAASIVLLQRMEIGAAAALVLLASAYETGDYLIGSGARNPYEGPLAGIAAMLVITFVISAAGVPPFDFAGAWAFGGLAAVLCPIGQLVVSAILPSAGSSAPGLRRLDSLLITGPAWAWLVGLYITAHPT